MSDCVVDTSFIATANENLAELAANGLLQKKVAAIERVVRGDDRLRVNQKLLTEYGPHIREQRNDIVEQFVALLDDPSTVKVPTNNLRHADKAKANQCRWPTHDQHVLAAAVGGEQVTIHVTEQTLARCAAAVRRIFGFKVSQVP